MTKARSYERKISFAGMSLRPCWMAREILRLFEVSNLAEEKIFAMGGHEEGVVSFGKDLKEAGEKIFALL